MPLSSIVGGTFEEEDHLYFNEQGQRVLSVTQILQSVGLINYEGIRAEVLERKSQIGKALHKSVEYLVQNCLNWDTVSDEVMPYVLGVESWIKESGFISESQEQQGIHEINGMSFGYQYDHLGKIWYKGKERKTLLDIKSCFSFSPSWKIQLAGYEIAAPPVEDGYLRVALQAKKDGTAKPYFFEDSGDKKVFLYSCFLSIWKINNQIN